MADRINLTIDFPSRIAEMLLDDNIDVGLVPVAIIPKMEEHYIISDYCISCDGEVASVCLFSEVPLGKIEKVLLDYQSRTSVELLKILVEQYWKINPVFEPDIQNYTLLKKNISSHNLTGIDARQEAVWVENTTLNFIQEGNMGSKIGIDSPNSNSNVKAVRLKDFLTKKIDFLKLDIEGAEYLVLKDIAENLHHVTNMFVEYHGSFSQNEELLEIFQIIVKSGFQFYIKEAAENYHQPFLPAIKKLDYDVQLNIFCFRDKK